MRCKACNSVINIPQYRKVLVDIDKNIHEEIEEELCSYCIGVTYNDEVLDYEVPSINCSLGDGNYMTPMSGNSDDY